MTVTQEWPGLPRGVKFDPSDQEIIWHLLGKAGVGNLKPDPFIEEFIPTVDKDDGIYEKEGEFVISKVFFQQQQVKQSEISEDHLAEGIEATTAKVDPVTPKSVTPEPPRAERRHSDFDPVQESTKTSVDPSLLVCEMEYMEDEVEDAYEIPDLQDQAEKNTDHMQDEVEDAYEIPDLQDHLKAEDNADQIEGDHNNQAGEDPKWWDSESQNLLDSQQLVEGLSLCDDLLQSQSPNRDECENRDLKGKPRLSDYAHLGPESLKKDLEECQHLVLDPANIEIDTPPDFRLSQLEFGSQESFLAWGGSKVAD
ncbi:hypothetical protein RJ639_001385 [Escallonia herrerae]|uniref:NAC domain-containing protein n=1 Tax=Escallonia herrerae TaxID=1293975 RepID=A0AA88X7F5_9ASTE|nr:hypothetical protein RJ639_001385 [Escallonia herrerae]